MQWGRELLKCPEKQYVEKRMVDDDAALDWPLDDASAVACPLVDVAAFDDIW